MELNSPELAAPLAPPSITIAGRTYTLKFSLVAKYVLSSLKVTSAELAAMVRRADTPDPANLATTLRFFAAAAAHNFVESGESILTPEQWALKIDTEEKYREVCQALVAMLVKMAPAAVTAQAQPEAGAPN